jgi:hypothetical protein
MPMIAINEKTFMVTPVFRTKYANITKGIRIIRTTDRNASWSATNPARVGEML